jgi:hypothetical protein
VRDGRIVARAGTVLGAVVLATISLVFVVLSATPFLRPLAFGNLPITFVILCGRSIS